MRFKRKITAIAICTILLLCAAAGTVLSGCTGRNKSTVSVGENDLSYGTDRLTPSEANGSTPKGSADGKTTSYEKESAEGNTVPSQETPPAGTNGKNPVTGADGATIPSGSGETRPNGSILPTRPNGSILPSVPGGVIIPSVPGGETVPSVSGGSSENATKDDHTNPTNASQSGNHSQNQTKPGAVSGTTSGNGGNPSSDPKQTSSPADTTKPAAPDISGFTTIQSAPSAGFANIVVFVQTESTAAVNYYADKTNEINKRWNTDERSLTNFMKLASNGKFTVNNIFPQYNSAQNVYVSYVVPDSCVSSAQSGDGALLSAVISRLSVDSSVNLDCTGDGVIDNLTIVVHKDNYTPSSKSEVLWPHKSVYGGSDRINGKRIRNYNVLNTSIFTSIINGYGVISHEFMHSLGYPDLYKRFDSENLPVGMWDIMGTTNDYMSYPLAYLRNKISGWANVSTVTKTSSSLTLSAQSSATGIHAYILKNPSMSESEFFVVEYRKLGNSAAGQFTLDSRIPSYYASTGRNGGIIIYRVNTNIDGLSNFGSPNAIYVFRPGVSSDTACGSDLKASALSKESGRTSFGSSDLSAGMADNALTYSNGVNSGIVVKNVGSASGSTITFDVEFPDSSQGWYEEGSGAANTAYASDVSLTIDSSGKISVVTTASGGSAGLYAAAANGSAWTKTKPLAGNLMDARTLVWNGKQYVLYIDLDSSGLYLASLSSGTLSGKQLVASSVQDYAVAAGSDGIYIAYTDSQLGSKLTVKKYNGSLSVLLNQEAIGNAGNLSAACVGNSLYVAYRAWSDGNAVRILRVSDKKYMNTSGISGSCFVMTADGQNLYIAVGTDSSSGSMQVYRCGAGADAFTQLGGNICQGNIHELDIAVSGGKVFVVCVNQTAKTTEVYSYTGSGWSRFGSQLEGSSTLLDAEIALSGGKVIVAYISNGNIYVRSKTY